MEKACRYDLFGQFFKKEAIQLHEARDRLRKELLAAKTSISLHPYRREKAESVERSLSALPSCGPTGSGEVAFGYDVGVRPPYGGLPIGLFKDVDPAIQELIDKLAKNRNIALTGYSCSGHVNLYGEGEELRTVFSIPSMKLLFYPDEWKENLRQKVWLMLLKVDELQETADGTFKLHNGLTGIRLDGTTIGNGLILPSLSMQPVFENSIGTSIPKGSDKVFVKLLSKYWNSVVSALSSVLSLDKVQQIEPGFFTRQIILNGGREMEIIPEQLF